MRTRISEGDLIDVGFGIVGDARRVTALGVNQDLNTDTLPEDIWSGGGIYPWMTALTSLEAFSSNPNDTSTGTGARTIFISGLDAGYNEISAAVVLNGATVAIPTKFFRINSVTVSTAGSGQVNAGDILIRDAGGGTTRAIIPAGYGITRQSQYTVPAGWTMQVISILFCFNRSTSATRTCTFATFFQASNGIYRLPLEISITNNQTYRHDGTPGIQVNEKTDFGIRCTSVSTNSSDVTSAWLGILRKNGN